MNLENLIKSVVMLLVVTTCLILISKGVHAKAPTTEKPTYTFKNAKYISTYDGDTFRVHIPSLHDIFGKRLGVRILGINTPEIRSRNKYEKILGYKAKAYTKSILDNGKRLVLSECVRGTFSRIVCKVANDKTKDLGADLIRLGFAEVYKK